MVGGRTKADTWMVAWCLGRGGVRWLGFRDLRIWNKHRIYKRGSTPNMLVYRLKDWRTECWGQREGLSSQLCKAGSLWAGSKGAGRGIQSPDIEEVHSRSDSGKNVLFKKTKRKKKTPKKPQTNSKTPLKGKRELKTNSNEWEREERMEWKKRVSVSLYIQTLAKFRRPRWEKCQFKVSLRVIVRPCQKNKQKAKQP